MNFSLCSTLKNVTIYKIFVPALIKFSTFSGLTGSYFQVKTGSIDIYLDTLSVQTLVTERRMDLPVDLFNSSITVCLDCTNFYLIIHL